MSDDPEATRPRGSPGLSPTGAELNEGVRFKSQGGSVSDNYNVEGSVGILMVRHALARAALGPEPAHLVFCLFASRLSRVPCPAASIVCPCAISWHRLRPLQGAIRDQQAQLDAPGMRTPSQLQRYQGQMGVILTEAEKILIASVSEIEALSQKNRELVDEVNGLLDTQRINRETSAQQSRTLRQVRAHAYLESQLRVFQHVVGARQRDGFRARRRRGGVRATRARRGGGLRLRGAPLFEQLRVRPRVGLVLVLPRARDIRRQLRQLRL